MSGEPVWTPRPDPALGAPISPGLHPHRHEPDHLYGWVFLQHQVWVDYWGNEHEIELMPADYVRNVIGFCEQRTLRIALMVWAEIAYQTLAHRAGLAQTPSPAILDLASRLREIRRGDNGSLSELLDALPLLQALRQRLDVLEQESRR